VSTFLHTSHILEAIVEKAHREQRRTQFHDIAERRYAEIVASGGTIPWSEMRRYLQDRLIGKQARRPTAEKAR
jgi:hypothetical protein